MKIEINYQRNFLIKIQWIDKIIPIKLILLYSISNKKIGSCLLEDDFPLTVLSRGERSPPTP